MSVHGLHRFSLMLITIRSTLTVAWLLRMWTGKQYCLKLVYFTSTIFRDCVNLPASIR